ncbi:MAG: hypothetical protein ABW321_34690 [Polyangiales bacterium]
MALSCLSAPMLAAPSTAEAQLVLARRVDLKVLVLSAGDVGTAMVKAGLDEGLVPYTLIDLTKSNRQVINDAFLADTVSLFTRRAKFQAVVLPNEAPSQLTAAEMAALDKFEREFKIRQLDSYVYPSPAVGLNWPANPGYLGPMDGKTATITAEGKASGFNYLNGPVKFEDISPTVLETYGYLSVPLPADTVNKKSFTSFANVTIPEADGAAGVLLGVYNDNGREQMVLTSSMNQYQFQQQALFNGILNWLTYGVHLGTEKNFFAVHIDDVFLSDARWSVNNNCTVGDDCPATVDEPDILMTVADVDYSIQWQNQNGIKLDMVYNAGGYNDAIALGPYPMGDRFINQRAQFRWMNHTYDHLYLGCVQDFSTIPFRCATGSNGQIIWATYQEVFDQIRNNQNFATQKGLNITRGELVTGEHSGLRRAPQEPSDNPNLARAFTNTGITVVGSDNSREQTQRVIGSARTSPRYPMNIFYNVGKKAEETDEYNWIYTSAANGGSGICENNPTSTCIEPLDLETGYDNYIVPIEARNALLHIVSNSPRSHYAHQSNLAEDRILYTALNKILADYKTAFNANTPVVNATMTALSNELKNQTDWASTRSRITAYVQNGQLRVTLANGTSAVTTPVTVPNGTTGSSLGAYGGYLTGWSNTPWLIGQTYRLPATVGYVK